MNRVVVFGNSGSGKSTLAKSFATKYHLSHLDLDVLAWEDTFPPTRKSLQESAEQIEQFMTGNPNWIIEGCYSDLLGLVIKNASEIIFLNPGVQTCMDNCRNRPWEPHKYESLEEQNKNLDMLLDWVKQYPDRDDEFSLHSHQKLFNEFNGKKTEYKINLNVDEL